VVAQIVSPTRVRASPSTVIVVPPQDEPLELPELKDEELDDEDDELEDELDEELLDDELLDEELLDEKHIWCSNSVTPKSYGWLAIRVKQRCAPQSAESSSRFPLSVAGGNAARPGCQA
jgi:hypothetical protein